MSIRNRDIIRRMENNGDFEEAERFQRTLEREGHHEWETPDRWNPADGAQHTRAGDCAERAYEDLQRSERYEELRHEEEEQDRLASERHQREQERQQEEDFYASQPQEQEGESPQEEEPPATTPQ